MKSSTKSSCFNELGHALKAAKKPQQSSQKVASSAQCSVQQNILFNRSSSQAQNILQSSLSSSNTNNNPNMFSQRNSNVNLKLQLNATNKLQKKTSQDHIKRSSIDQPRNKQSPMISSPRIVENNEVQHYQNSGFKSQYLNNSTSSGNSTSIGNSKQIIGQIKLSLAKSKSKANIITSQNQQVAETKISRKQSQAQINSPNNERMQERNKRKKCEPNTRYTDYDNDCGITLNEDGELNNYKAIHNTCNDKENIHSNIPIPNSKKINSSMKDEDRKHNLPIKDQSSKKRESYKQSLNTSQKSLQKKKSEGYIDHRIANESILLTQQPNQNTDNINYHNAHKNSIIQILGRARSQDKIIFEKEYQQDYLGQSTAAVPITGQITDSQNSMITNMNQVNNTNPNKHQQSQSSSSSCSMSMMMMILAANASQNNNHSNNNNYSNINNQTNINNQSNINNYTNNNNNNNNKGNNNNYSISSNHSNNNNNNSNNKNNNMNSQKCLTKSSSKQNLCSHKTLPQIGSKASLSQKKLLSNQQNQTASIQQKQNNNSLQYLKNNISKSGNLSKSNSSLLKYTNSNNQLNFSRGNLDTMHDNTHILLTDHSFSNNSKNPIIQQFNPNIPTNSLYRVPSSSSFNGKNIQTPVREIADAAQIAYLSDNHQQYYKHQQNQQQQQQQQLFVEIQKQGQQKVNVDEYKKISTLQSNKNRKEEQQSGGKSCLTASTTQNMSNLFFQNNTSNYQNTSNNIILNTQNDTQDAGSFLKYANNPNFLLDCKSNATDTSSCQLGCSSTQKRMLNSSTRLNTSQHPNLQQQQQHIQQQQAMQQIIQQNSCTPQRKHSTPYIDKNINLPTNSSFSSTHQSAFVAGQSHNLNNNTINNNTNNILNNNNQNVVISQYVQNYNAIRCATQQSETNFTFQNNSQNPSSFVVPTSSNNNNNNNGEQQFRESEQKGINDKNGNIIQLQALDKYATSSFQVKTQEDEQPNESIYRRQSQQIQQQQVQQNNLNQKQFSVLFNNLFSSKGDKKAKEESNNIQNKGSTMNKRKNSSSLLCQNSSLGNNFMQDNTKECNQRSPSEIDKEVPQSNVQLGQLPRDQQSINQNQQRISNTHIKRTPSLTQCNFDSANNQLIAQQLESNNQNLNLEAINQQLQTKQNWISSPQNFDKNKQSQQQEEAIQKTILQQKQEQQQHQQEQGQQQQYQNFQQQQQQSEYQQEEQQKYQQEQQYTQQWQLEQNFTQNKTNNNINNQNCEQLQKQMQLMYKRVNERLIKFKDCENAWKNEKNQLVVQLESLQNQINFLTEQNSHYKRSVSQNHQYEKNLTSSISSSIEDMLQQF